MREYMTGEALPLATVFREVAAFLTNRADAVLFGAHAVNAYCGPERMTQDVDVMSTKAAELAEDLRRDLASKLHIAVRVREVAPGLGFRVYQVRKPKDRHLVDVRQVSTLPDHQVIDGVRVATPTELAAMKTLAVAQRGARPKGLSDLLDLKRLLLSFPDLKVVDGSVAARLRALGASKEAFARWQSIASEPIEPDLDDGY